MNTMIDITDTELELIDGGEYQKGAICAFTAGLAFGIALVNPLAGLLTFEVVTVAACTAELA